MYPKEYKGWLIWPKNYCGMWMATNYSDGYGQLAADTLEGIRDLITSTIQKSGIDKSLKSASMEE